jgi:hypothetical protein
LAATRDQSELCPAANIGTRTGSVQRRQATSICAPVLGVCYALMMIDLGEL